MRRNLGQSGGRKPPRAARQRAGGADLIGLRPQDAAAVAPEPVGLPCPACGCCHHWTLYTRPAPAGGLLRRRECRNCGRRFSTLERPRERPNTEGGT
jgi:hypothetical protein